MRYAIAIALIIYGTMLSAQDNSTETVPVSAASIDNITGKVSKLDDKITQSTDRYLKKLGRQEEKLRRRLAKIDSSKTAEIFGDVKNTYVSLSQKLNNATGKFDKLTSGEYIAGLDSLQGSLAFLKDAAQIISKTKDIRQKLGSSLNQVNQLQHKLKEAADIQNYLQERQQQLQQLLSTYTNLPKNIGKYFGKYQQDVFYYTQQVREYKEALNNPDKLVRKILSTLQTIPAFSKFFSRYSMLASLFPTPDNYGTPQALAGLQTRADVMQIIQQQLPVANTGGANGNPAQYLQQQMQQAQGELTKLKDKLSELGISSGGSGDMAMPNFKPNKQKTKSFLQRIELGTNIQTRRATDYFPTSTDFAFTAGYKLSDKSIIGIGLSGKMGWGKSWNQIKFTAEGIGFRSFAEWKAPDLFKTNSRFMASLWFTAGAELNYTKTVESLAVFKNYSNWTKSALAGLSKKYTMNSPLKKGKKIQGSMQVLYDFLYNKHVPPTPAFVWRVGYNF